MRIGYLLLPIVLLSMPFMYSGLFAGYTTGSLANSWQINMTVFMTHFSGNILFVADYERNMLQIGVNKVVSRQTTITVSFNEIVYHIYLFSLCGCDPCHNWLVHFNFMAKDGIITLICNNYGHYKFKKNDNKNRDSIGIDNRIKEATTVPNRLCVAFISKISGCLNSFNYNDSEVAFELAKSIFLNSCPRKCKPGICKKGQCRALYLSGPVCDCSTTAYNGKYCKNNLNEYTIESKKSYEIENTDEFYFKLSWRRFLFKRYCLLQLVHRDGKETLSIQGSYVMKNGDILSEINGDGVNFISVYNLNQNFIIKVNNKIVHKRQVLFEKLMVHVGYTVTNENCETFKGEYDFDYGDSQLLEVKYTSNIPIITTKEPSSSQNIFQNETLIFCAIGFFILVVIIVLAILIVIKCILPRQRIKKSRLNENPYDAAWGKGNMKIGCHDDDYDSMDHTKLYSEPKHIMPCESSKNNRVKVMLPVLPPRNY